MNTSVNSDYNNDIPTREEITRQLTNIAKAGFTHIQWIHGWNGDDEYTADDMAYAAATLKELGLNAHSLHATEGCVRVTRVNGELQFNHRYRHPTIQKDYTSEDEAKRKAGVGLLRNRIRMCDAIGAHAMVLHMQLPFALFEENPPARDAYFDAASRSLEEVEKDCKSAGVKIALENLPGTPMAHMEYCLDLLFDRFSPDFLGFCYDSGHATLQHTHDPLYFLEKYCDRLYATHLQDNDSIAEELMDDDAQFILHDKHRTPFTGVCNWEGIAALVAKAPLDLPADFEVGLRGDTPEDEFAQLLACHEAAERFAKMVEAARSLLR